MIAPGTKLEGTRVRLRPMELGDWQGLLALAGEAELWRYFRAGSLGEEGKMRAWVKEALALREKGIDYPFVTEDVRSGSVMGSTRYRLLDADNRSVEIGGTWLGQAYRGTGVNGEAKRLMLEYAFEVMKVVRVQFRTDLRNLRSQRALEKLGAVREGVLREDFIYADGYRRSTVMYSILEEEWLGVKQPLREKDQN
jgi:N-acetyltransferase